MLGILFATMCSLNMYLVLIEDCFSVAQLSVSMATEVSQWAESNSSGSVSVEQAEGLLWWEQEEQMQHFGIFISSCKSLWEIHNEKARFLNQHLSTQYIHDMSKA